MQKLPADDKHVDEVFDLLRKREQEGLSVPCSAVIGEYDDTSNTDSIRDPHCLHCFLALFDIMAHFWLQFVTSTMKWRPPGDDWGFEIGVDDEEEWMADSVRAEVMVLWFEGRITL